MKHFMVLQLEQKGKDYPNGLSDTITCLSAPVYSRLGIHIRLDNRVITCSENLCCLKKQLLKPVPFNVN